MMRSKRPLAVTVIVMSYLPLVTLLALVGYAFSWKIPVALLLWLGFMWYRRRQRPTCVEQRLEPAAQIVLDVRPPARAEPPALEPSPRSDRSQLKTLTTPAVPRLAAFDTCERRPPSPYAEAGASTVTWRPEKEASANEILTADASNPCRGGDQEAANHHTIKGVLTNETTAVRACRDARAGFRGAGDRGGLHTDRHGHSARN